MKGMPLPYLYDLQGLLDFKGYNNTDSLNLFNLVHKQFEPNSVLDNISSPSPPTSSLCGGGSCSTDTPGLAAVSDNPGLPVGGPGKCGLGLEDWEGVLSDCPTQDQLKWIMGDVDTNVGVGVVSDFDFNGGFGVVDHGFCFDNVNPMFGSMNQRQQIPFESTDVKPFGSQVLINQQQNHVTQNQSMFMPLGYPQDQHFVMQQPKRHNSMEPNASNAKRPFLDSGRQVFVERPQPAFLQPKVVDEQQGVVDQLYKAAELVQSGNFQFAQEILARLNHYVSPIGKPFHRAAFYCKEALQLLLPGGNNNVTTVITPNSPFSLVYKIGAYKSFSEISPVVQFANFTCNQALLEALDGFDRIHVIDFDIGYGGQWASLLQELAMRSGGAPSLKITAFASASTYDHLELGLTQENLNHFANELNITFEFEIVSLEAFNSVSWSFSDAIAVNLPVGSFFNYQVSLPMVLRFVKQLSPKIVVSVDKGCDRNDLPFPNHVIHSLQSYSNLLESLDAVNVNIDALQKIERFLIQPGIEQTITGRYRFPEKTQHWRILFMAAGFVPLGFSNFTESQAECVVKRTPVRGFHVEKRQSSLVLCWQRRELISASAWRC